LRPRAAALREATSFRSESASRGGLPSSKSGQPRQRHRAGLDRQGQGELQARMSTAWRSAISGGHRGPAQQCGSLAGLGGIYDHLKRFDEADRAYEVLQKMVGTTPQILNNLGYHYMLKGDFAPPSKRSGPLRRGTRRTRPSRPIWRCWLNGKPTRVRARLTRNPVGSRSPPQLSFSPRGEGRQNVLLPRRGAAGYSLSPGERAG